MRKYFLFTFVFLLIGKTYGLQDSSKVIDTLFVSKNDTSVVKIISYPQSSWIEKNEGTFLGAFLAGLIAILSVYLTTRSTKKSRLAKETEIYCGLLYAIKIELIYQSKNHDFLIQELEVIKHNSLIANEIITDSPSRTITLNFLQDVRSKIISTELFNTRILLLLSAYMNKCELVNCDIKFERLIKLSEKFKDKVNFPESTKTYFDIIIKQVNDLKKAIPDIISYINADLKSFGKTSDIDESEYLKIAS